MLRILVISTQAIFPESLHAVMFHVLDDTTMYLMFFALLLILSAF
jgi:hypothetical protein